MRASPFLSLSFSSDVGAVPSGVTRRHHSIPPVRACMHCWLKGRKWWFSALVFLNENGLQCSAMQTESCHCKVLESQIVNAIKESISISIFATEIKQCLWILIIMYGSFTTNLPWLRLVTDLFSLQAVRMFVVFSLLKKKENIGSIQSWDIERKEWRLKVYFRTSFWWFASDTRATY